jgi:hypothetical protein
MPALSYSKKNIEVYNFKDKIILNSKKHTIRRYGPGLIKRPFRVGDTLMHYKNWRKKNPPPFKFHENKCLWVTDIEMKIEEGIFGYVFNVYINKKKIESLLTLSEIAINDGFNLLDDFADFFIQAGLPFHGQIIGWTDDVNYEERE